MRRSTHGAAEYGPNLFGAFEAFSEFFFSTCEIAAGGVGFLNLFSSRLGGRGNDIWVVGFHHLRRTTPEYIPAG